MPYSKKNTVCKPAQNLLLVLRIVLVTRLVWHTLKTTVNELVYILRTFCSFICVTGMNYHLMDRGTSVLTVFLTFTHDGHTVFRKMPERVLVPGSDSYSRYTHTNSHMHYFLSSSSNWRWEIISLLSVRVICSLLLIPSFPTVLLNLGSCLSHFFTHIYTHTKPHSCTWRSQSLSPMAINVIGVVDYPSGSHMLYKAWLRSCLPFTHTSLHFLTHA